MGRNRRSSSSDAKAMEMEIWLLYKMKYGRVDQENGRRVRGDACAIRGYMGPFPRADENHADVRPQYYDMRRIYR